MLTSIIAVVVTFGLVIFLHEFGHFLMCKLLKIRVEVFSFGFGPEIKSFQHGETRYVLSWIPLGGYVKPAGEDLKETKGGTDEYFSKPWHSRLLVVLAGPFMNYVLAFALFSAVIYFKGEPVASNDPVIGDTVENYPAQAAGLKEGDRVLSVNAATVATWQQLADIIHKLPEQEAKITYRRGAQDFSISVPVKKDPSGKWGVIGIAPETTYKPVPLWVSAGMGLYQCYYWTQYTFVTLASKIYHRENPDLSGPVGIVHMVGKAAHMGFANLVFLIGLISVAVGIFNLFPIPLLDGGHAVLYIWEGITRRRLTEKAMQVANSMGVAVLVGILLFATYSDIMRLAAKPKAEKPAAEQQK